MVTADPHMSGLLREGSSRFHQMDYLHGRVELFHQTAVDAIRDLVSSVPISQLNEESELKGKISKITKSIGDVCNHTTLYTEMFYIIAFRQVEITRFVNKRIFNQERIIPEPKGVRDARNKLILHPEQVRDGAILSLFYTFAAEGIKLKEPREPHENQDYVDMGFGPNVAEFSDFWLKWWQKSYSALSNISGEQFTL